MSEITCKKCNRTAARAGGVLITTADGATLCQHCRAMGPVECACFFCGKQFSQSPTRGDLRLYCSNECRAAGKSAKMSERAAVQAHEIIGTWQIGHEHRSVVRIGRKYRCAAALEADGQYSFLEPLFFATRSDALAWVRGESVEPIT